MERRVFLTAAAVAAALATDACAKPAGALESVEPQSSFDYAAFEKAVDRDFDARQLWDVDGYEPTTLGSIKNAYNGYQFGFGIAPSKIGMAVCLRGNANAFAYDDAIWSKYRLGEAFGFKDPNGNAVESNIFFHARSQPVTTADPNDVKSMYQDATIEALQRRGLVVLVCGTAAAEQARSLVDAGLSVHGVSAEQVHHELLGHLVPNAISVPAMVSAIGVLQNRFKYAYATG